MDRSIFRKIWHNVFRSGNPLYLFIGLNAIVFLFLNVINVFAALRILPGSILSMLMSVIQLPAAIGDFIYKPWTVLTYMFTQMGLFHFIFNMLWLYWLGRIFLDFLSNRQFTFAYLLGGVGGGVLFLLVYLIVPAFHESRHFHVLIGSSAAVSAVVIATATLLPNYTIRMLFFGNVKLKYLALAFIVLDLLGVGGANAGGSIAHLGGALMGFVFIKQLQNGNDWSLLIAKKPRRKRSKLRVASSRNDATTTSGRNYSGQPDQDLIDGILDKISQSGYDSLSKAEKEALFKVSRTNKTEN